MNSVPCYLMFSLTPISRPNITEPRGVCNLDTSENPGLQVAGSRSYKAAENILLQFSITSSGLVHRFA